MRIITAACIILTVCTAHAGSLRIQRVKRQRIVPVKSERIVTAPSAEIKTVPTQHADLANRLQLEEAEQFTIPGNNRRNWAAYTAEQWMRYLDAITALHGPWTRGLDKYDTDWMMEWALIPITPIRAIPFATASIRAVAEIRTPRTAAEAANQQAELEYFRTLGYSAVMAVWYGESPHVLSNALADLHADGWTVLVAYGQREGRDKCRPYIPLKNMRKALSALLEHASAFLPAWRGTSAPHTHNAPARTQYQTRLSHIARGIYPAIPIIGETFLKGGQLVGDIIDGASGALVLNAGYLRRYPPDVIAMLHAKAGTDIPALTLVIGPNPYYASYHEITGWTKGGIRQKVERIEGRYRAAGSGTITLCGDGANGRAPVGKTNGTSDSLTQSEWRIDK